MHIKVQRHHGVERLPTLLSVDQVGLLGHMSSNEVIERHRISSFQVRWSGIKGSIGRYEAMHCTNSTGKANRADLSAVAVNKFPAWSTKATSVSQLRGVNMTMRVVNVNTDKRWC